MSNKVQVSDTSKKLSADMVTLIRSMAANADMKKYIDKEQSRLLLAVDELEKLTKSFDPPPKKKQKNGENLLILQCLIII